MIGCKTTTQESKSGNGVTNEISSDLESKVDGLIAEMTPEEKVGQMTQVNLNVVLKGGYGNDEGAIDEALLDSAVNRYKVGSLLNSINHAYTQEKWLEIITKIQDKTKAGKGTKIPVMYGIDAIHGTTFTLNSTLFPHNIGLAASRIPELAREGADITAEQVRASGIRWNFDPVFDIARNPLWPRFPETYGEDPYLIAEMGSACVRGYEEDGLDSKTGVASCMKHFVGYSASRSGRDRTPSYIPELELREYYLPQFKRAIEAGASTIMINSGEVNGIPVHASEYLLTQVLRRELGFKGLVVTDWEDINRLHERHMTAETMEEAVRQGIMAGIDMSMTPHDFKFHKHATALYKKDSKFATRVDESVKRILVLKGRLGLLDFETAYPEPEAIKNFDKKEFAGSALEAARQTMTLLKNREAALPLAKGSTIVLAGPNANNIPSLHGCWSYTWQGNVATYTVKDNGHNENPGEVIKLFPDTTVSIKTAFEEMLGSRNVRCISKGDYQDVDNYRLPSTAGADAIVLCLGEDAYAESPGSIQDLMLDKRQLALAQAALATGKKVIVVLVEGRPRIISDFAEGEKSVDAILHAYWPGSQGARAIAQTVLGDNNPGGKLPFTYHRSTGDFVTYDYKWTEMNVENSPGNFTDDGYNPLYPFGHGLSYTNFEYSNFKLSTDTLVGADTLTVSVTVKNAGTVAGDEVVELYSRDMYGSVTPNNRRLRKFSRVSFGPGEEKVIRFKLVASDLQMAVENVNGASKSYSYDTEEGAFKLMIGGFGWERSYPTETPWTAALDRTFKHALGFYYKK